MGKTKTAFVTGLEEEDKSSFDRLREKREKQKREAEKIHISGLKGGQRIKVMDEGPIIEEAPVQKTEPGKEKKESKKAAVKVRGKKYREIKTTIDQTKNYPLKEAIELVKKSSYSKFDGTMEVHFVLRKAGLNTQVTLPHSSGKTKRIEVAGEETLTKLAGGKIDFDVLVATPDMMPKLVPFARLLGPKGLMPNPKNGTLVSDIKKANSFSANSTTLKTEKEYPLIHTIIGKVSQNDKELTENFQAIIKAIGDKQIVKAYLKATMSPSVKIQV
ncbi:MAG: hypothetical protein ABIJ85_02260 [bacterium]